MTFKETIIKLRKDAKMSQQEVANSISVARATYASLEAGRREPNLSEIRKLSELYQISPQHLIDGVAATFEEKADDVKLEAPSTDSGPRKPVTIHKEKLRQVLLYVLEKVGAKPNVGETVLYKLLYFIDFDYYEKYGQSITGLTYVRNHFGPTPKAAMFNGVVDAMKNADELDVAETKYFNHNQRKYLPNTRAALDKLSGRELIHIDAELSRLGDKSAGELSELSHQDTPWLAAKDNQPIDYQLARYRTSETSVKEPEDEV